MSKPRARIVICGAGIAGISAAYHLAVVRGVKDIVIVEEGDPLSLTSDKSTEAYRNWWPGPDRAMTAFMNKSIDLIEALARGTGNRFHFNRRGYLFASADPGKIKWLIDMATVAAGHGAGPVRVHDAGSSGYEGSRDRLDEDALTGADIITDPGLIRQHFPYLAPETKVVAHARRAGWLSAQQLGMTMLDAARAAGVTMLRGRLTRADIRAGRLHGVDIEGSWGRQTLIASHLILATGPMTKALAAEMGIDLPILTEPHFKISLPDSLGVVPRSAPMLIWLDEQRLPWSSEERDVLAADPSTRWLTEPFPAGAHGRPDGAGASTTLLMLFNYHSAATDPVFPLPESDHYGEITLRGMSTMVPGLRAYIDKGVRPYIDGGYYTKTPENRPLIGPTGIDGVFMSCAYSGFGIMASCAGGDLIARYVLGEALPDYAPAFQLSRYQDPAYQAQLANWGDGSQL